MERFGFNDEDPEYLLVLANHNPRSTILRDELEKVRSIADEFPLQIKIAVATFFGYALYGHNVFTLPDFLRRFESQIH